MARLRKEQAEHTRERILAAARKLFTEKGYFATGTNEIVLAAGVGTRGALYHHFANKESLLLAVARELESELAARIACALTGDRWSERLEQALHAFLDASTEPEVRRILLVDGPAAVGWGAWRESAARFGLRAIQQMLDAGCADGSLAVPNATAMSYVLLAAVDAAALYVAHAPEPEVARAAAAAAIDRCLAGLRADAAAE